MERGQLRRVTTASGPDRNSFNPVISADGRTIVFESDSDFKGEGIPAGQTKIWLFESRPSTPPDPEPEPTPTPTPNPDGDFTVYLPLVRK